MFSEIIQPRFTDTDALGHINNAMIPVWFEGARDPVFRIFMPDLSLENWRLILAKIEVNFHAEMFYGIPVELKTFITRIGGSSFDIYQEAWQEGIKKASGTAVMVHYDNKEKKSLPLPDDIKEQLASHSFAD